MDLVYVTTSSSKTIVVLLLFARPATPVVQHVMVQISVHLVQPDSIWVQLFVSNHVPAMNISLEISALIVVLTVKNVPRVPIANYVAHSQTY